MKNKFKLRKAESYIIDRKGINPKNYIDVDQLFIKNAMVVDSTLCINGTVHFIITECNKLFVCDRQHGKPGKSYVTVGLESEYLSLILETAISRWNQRSVVVGFIDWYKEREYFYEQLKSVIFSKYPKVDTIEKMCTLSIPELDMTKSLGLLYSLLRIKEKMRSEPKMQNESVYN